MVANFCMRLSLLLWFSCGLGAIALMWSCSGDAEKGLTPDQENTRFVTMGSEAVLAIDAEDTGGSVVGNPIIVNQDLSDLDLTGGSVVGNPIAEVNRSNAEFGSYISSNEGDKVETLMQRDDVNFAVLMTDKPAEDEALEHLYVEFGQATALARKGKNIALVDIPLARKTFDIAALRDGKTSVLASMQFEAGSYEGIELTIVSAKVVFAGVTHVLHVPGKRVRILGRFSTIDSAKGVLVVDFLPEESIARREGRFLLNPIVKMRTYARYQKQRYTILFHQQAGRADTKQDIDALPAKVPVAAGTGDLVDLREAISPTPLGGDASEEEPELSVPAVNLP